MMEVENHVHDLIGAYVLGAVTSQEETLVKEHLPTCASCRTLERELREVEALLPALSGEMPPPAELKTRLMAIVRAEAGEAGEDSVSPSTMAMGPHALQPTRDLARPRLPRATTAPRRTISPLLAMAAMLVLVVVGLGVWRLSTTAHDTRPALQYALRGTAAAPEIGGSLTYDQNGTRLDLHLHGLKPLPGNRVYELWLIRGATLVKGIGAFRPDASGNGHYSTTGENVPDYTLAGVTVEKAPLAAKPTLPMVAAGQLGG